MLCILSHGIEAERIVLSVAVLNDAAADDIIIFIEDDGLARRDGALRFVEANRDAVLPERDDGGRCLLVFIANARLDAEVAVRRLDGNPVDIARG